MNLMKKPFINPDLSPVFEKWPYEPGRVKVRKILGLDGREKIQMRIDLGILQMETQGRPDGERPHDSESLFDYHMGRLEKHIQIHGSSRGFGLTPEDCADIRLECLQYYYRYLSYYYLGDYKGVQRDTRRNLIVFDFVKAYSLEEDDRYLLEQYRPYVIMMNSRAKATLELQQDEPQDALDALVEGIDRIQLFFQEFEQEGLSEDCEELEVLRNMAEEIIRSMPVDQIQNLRQELQIAVAEEDFEKAAVLRDEIKRLESEGDD